VLSSVTNAKRLREENKSMETIISRPQRTIAQRWRQSFQKYAAVLRVSVASNLAYVGEVFFRALLLVVLVFILSQLWKTTFSLRGARMLSGFSIADMIWYLIITQVYVWYMSLSLQHRSSVHPLTVDIQMVRVCVVPA
jgi:hypothetical protein